MTQKPHVLIVGAGSIGERHLRCFQATGRAELALCEANRELADRVAKTYSIDSVTQDFADALRQPPDAVVICTPAPWHVPMAMQALTAGCHVLVEKPLSISLDGVDDLALLLRDRPLTLSIAYVYRAHPALQQMRSAIHSGDIGTIVQVVATCGQHFPLYRPAYREIYYKDRATGGGAVQDALTHVINAMEWLVGPTTQLVADCDHLVLEGVNVEDTVHVLTRHGGIMGCVSLNQHQAPNEMTLTVIGTRGAARFEMHTHQWSWMNTPGGSWQSSQLPVPERDTLFIRQAEAFLDAMTGASPACTLAEGVQTLKVNLAILESCTTRQWITLS